MSFTAICSTIFPATDTEQPSILLGPGLLRNPMNTMAPTRPTELHGCRVRLTTGPAAPAEARSQVRAAICVWDVPVDPDVAVLLTSELVTNAITHETGGTVTLAITCSCGQLRVDIHD